MKVPWSPAQTLGWCGARLCLFGQSADFNPVQTFCNGVRRVCMIYFRSDHESGPCSGIGGFDEAPPACVHLKQFRAVTQAQFNQQFFNTPPMACVSILMIKWHRLGSDEFMNNGRDFHISNIKALIKH